MKDCRKSGAANKSTPTSLLEEIASKDNYRFNDNYFSVKRNEEAGYYKSEDDYLRKFINTKILHSVYNNPNAPETLINPFA